MSSGDAITHVSARWLIKSSASIPITLRSSTIALHCLLLRRVSSATIMYIFILLSIDRKLRAVSFLY